MTALERARGVMCAVCKEDERARCKDYRARRKADPFAICERPRCKRTIARRGMCNRHYYALFGRAKRLAKCSR